MSEVARILCDCEITRIAMTADGTVTDLGRSTRLFTGEQRRAIIARDGWCQGPDCDANARWCEIHHIAWWERDGGSTSIPNGILLCRFHHQQVHRGNLMIDPVTHSVTSTTRVVGAHGKGVGRRASQAGNPGRGDPQGANTDRVEPQNEGLSRGALRVADPGRSDPDGGEPRSADAHHVTSQGASLPSPRPGGSAPAASWEVVASVRQEQSPGEVGPASPRRGHPADDLWTAAGADPPAEARWKRNARAG